MKILATGGTGFIGGSAVRRLLERGHEVAVLTRSGGVPEGAQAIQGDLARPPWKEIIAFNPDTCLHAAWITEPGVYLDAQENQDWLEWSRHFFEGLASQTGTERIFGLGTCVEYTASDDAVLEEGAPTGGNPWLYARCKDSLRQFLQRKAPEWGVGWAWGRVFYPYGPGEDPKRLFSQLIEKLGRGEELVLKTPNSTKDYIFIDDLAEAICLVIEARDFEGCINLGTGNGVTIRDLGRVIARLLNQDESLVREAGELGEDPLARVVADVSRLETLGMQWQFEIEEGVREMVEYSLNRR